jgi:hypothetical protein
MNTPTWKTLCKRTEDPKLAYIEYQLDNAGIPNRRNGRSFHAPILEVDSRHFDDAWKILDPIDEIPDDDERFLGAEDLRDSERAAHDEYAETRRAALNHRGEP